MKRKMNKKWVSLGMAGFVLMGSVFAGNATPISAHKNKETTNTEQQPSDKQNMPIEDSQNQTPDDNKNDNHFYNVITGSAIKTDKKANKKAKVKKAKKIGTKKIRLTLDTTYQWSNNSVSVTANGKTVKASIVKASKNTCIIKTNAKLKNATYTIKIKGLKTTAGDTCDTLTTKVAVKF